MSIRHYSAVCCWICSLCLLLLLSRAVRATDANAGKGKEAQALQQSYAGNVHLLSVALKAFHTDTSVYPRALDELYETHAAVQHEEAATPGFTSVRILLTGERNCSSK